jgi:hypothetical protein
MFNLKNLFTRALLALMLVTGAGAALAGPTYHVTINSAGYTGTGVIDFLFSAFVPADGTAFLSNFTGDYTGGSDMQGQVSGDIGTGLVLGTRDGFATFAQTLNLGGSFGFDLRFDSGSSNEALAFSVGLYSDTLDQYLGATGNLVAIDVVPGQPDQVYVDSGLATIAEAGPAGEVPEPATMASLMFGLALMGSTLRARRK